MLLTPVLLPRLANLNGHQSHATAYVWSDNQTPSHNRLFCESNVMATNCLVIAAVAQC